MKLIFLDRDGVINNYPGDRDYVKNWQEFRFLDGSLKALKSLTRAGFEIVIISNQAGVSKGLFSHSDLDDINKKMLKVIESYGARIRASYYCPHRDEDNCNCRKPKIGMIQKAVGDIQGSGLKPLKLKDTFFVGDSIRDVQTGKNAGCKTILVLSGQAREEDQGAWPAKPDYIAKDLTEASQIVLNVTNHV